MSEESNGGSKSIIAAEVEIIGTIKTEGSIRIDGNLEGELHSGGDVIVGKSAEIKGNLQVNSISVEGKINGNVTAKDKIELKTTAKVMGDIKSKRLAVEDGVTFVGRSEVNPGGVSAAPAGSSSAPPQGQARDIAPKPKA
jgi:cytoskeletal protein CcmA (bactofilin family)